jgi:hypothetical protein
MLAGISSIVGAHPEYEPLVRSHGCTFACIPGSLPKALLNSEAGNNMRDKTGSAGLAAAVEFFDGLSKVCKSHWHPDDPHDLQE